MCTDVLFSVLKANQSAETLSALRRAGSQRLRDAAALTHQPGKGIEILDLFCRALPEFAFFFCRKGFDFSKFVSSKHRKGFGGV